MLPRELGDVLLFVFLRPLDRLVTGESVAYACSKVEATVSSFPAVVIHLYLPYRRVTIRWARYIAVQP